MIYKALYAGYGPDSSPLKAVARIDGNKVDVIFVDDELFEGERTIWKVPFNLAIDDEPAQWDEFIESTESVWLSIYKEFKLSQE